MTTWYTVKFDYACRLPVGLAVLAHPDEEVAREGGRRMRAQFDRDPRPPPVHHRKTWKLMNPEAAFRQQLDAFLDSDITRDSCGDEFKKCVGEFKLIPICETTIEAKHREPSILGSARKIGPVRVSLANRMSMLERLLQQAPGTLTELMDALELTRSFVKIP
eukprot:12408341-Karenia_brevis.AAC.1